MERWESLEAIRKANASFPYTEPIRRWKEAVRSRYPGEERARLMIQGCVLNNPEFVRGIEALGGWVVVDGLSTGVGYWEGPVELSPGLSPLEALARRYLDKFPAPRMEHAEERYRRIVGLIEEFRVDGVITEIVRSCAPHIWDAPRLRERVARQGMPMLELDVEYGMPVTGQVKTRVQAFLEMLPGARR